MIKHFLFSLIAMTAGALPMLAGIDDLPVTTIDGRPYHYYVVAPKQTIYSICRDLGITKAQLIEANPWLAEEGVKANQRLYFAAAAPSPDIHVVADRETIYSIARRYGVTPSQLDAWNPGIRNGIHKGDRLIVRQPESAAPATGAAAAEAAPSGRRYIDYVVKDRETFYSVAHSHGISVGELEDANPDVSLLRKGMTLRIPVKGGAVIDSSVPVDEGAAPSPAPAPAPAAPSPAAAPAPSGSGERAAVASPAEINIAVVLPFMLADEERGRRAELMTEFYKGFLLAVDSLRHCDLPIHIQTYDTAGNTDTLRAIMARPELASARVIIAPDNAAHLEALADYGRSRGIDVMNLFVVADRSYADTPSLFQATIPHDAMYASAIEAMMQHFAEGLTPVILSPSAGKADKKAFVDQLTSALRRNGIDYTTIDYESVLTPADLSVLDRAGRYAFIPTTSSQAELNRILPALIEMKGTMDAYDPVRLYGYPEWTTYRGETLTNMHTLNTYVYSRFFTSPEDPWARRVEEAFDRWYGTPMAAAVPRQGLLGFDTGMFLINALRGGGGIADAPVYHGVQNAFRFVRAGAPDGRGGYVNDDLYFVNFRPSGLTDRISL